MKIHLRLYGTLGKDLPDHDRLAGLVVELPTGSTVGDLMDHLSIARKKVGIISVDGILVSASKRLGSDNFVQMYQPISGG